MERARHSQIDDVEERPGGRRLDTALATLLLAGTALFCWSLPHALGISDEGLFLYEAKRVAEGAVLYRDIFELITPLSTFLMAALFQLFGASVTTARVTDAVVHGLIVAAVFGIARRLGVRRCIAAAAALLDPAWFRPVWDVSNPHWLSTLFSLALFAELLRPPAARPVLAGVWAALIIAVQQQRGVPLALAAAALVALDRCAARGLAGAFRRLGAFAGGGLLVVGPLGAYITWTAGVSNVFEALVIFPLYNYRRQTSGAPWGANPTAWAGRYSNLRMLRALPLLIAPELVRAAVEWGRGLERWRQSLTVAVYGLSVVASILYLPDIVHLAFVAPVFAVMAADLLEIVLRALPGRRTAGVFATATAAVVIALSLGHARRVMAGRWLDYPVAYESAFGRIDVATAEEAAARDRLRALLADVPGRRLLIYPAGAALYLEVGATNPTPFQIMSAVYSRPKDFAQVAEILDREQTPYVIWQAYFGEDPLQEYFKRHYEVVPGSVAPLLLRRRDTPLPP